MTLDQQTRFFHQFSQMMGAGVPQLQAIDALRKQAASRHWGHVLDQLEDGIRRGESFSELVTRFRLFSPFIRGMIKAGETNGQLGARLGDIARFLEQIGVFRKQLFTQLIYPLLTIHVAIFLAPITKVVTGSMTEYFTSVLPLLAAFYASIAALYLLSRLLNRLQETAATWGWITFHFPLLGGITKTVALQRFLLTFGSLIEAGVSTAESISTAAEATGNGYVMHRMKVALRQVERGVSAEKALLFIRLFPRDIEGMLSTGEVSGTTGSMAKKAAEYLEMELLQRLQRLGSVLPVLVTLGIGGFVAYHVITYYTHAFDQILNP